MASPAVPQPQCSPCTEKAQLLYDYDHAAAQLARSTAVLARRLQALTKQEYESIWSFAQAARLRVDEARAALEQHCAEHGC